MLIALLALVAARTVAPPPQEVASERRGGELRVQVPLRAVIVAAALALAVEAVFLFGVRLIVNAVAQVLDGATLPRATWALLATGVAVIVAWRFLSIYAKLLLVGRATQGVETVRLVLRDPRA